MSTEHAKTREMQELLRIFICVTDVGINVVSDFAEDKLLLRYYGSFERFLDDKKHEMFHLCQSQKLLCCACPAAACYLKRKSLKSNLIFKQMYDDHGLQNDKKHVVCIRRNVVQVCLHQYITRSIAIHELDLSAISHLVQNCAQLPQNEIYALDKITNIRTRICLAYTKKDFSNDIFNDFLRKAWTDLQHALLDLSYDRSKIICRHIRCIRETQFEEEEITELTKNIVKVSTVSIFTIIFMLDVSLHPNSKHLFEESAKRPQKLISVVNRCNF